MQESHHQGQPPGHDRQELRSNQNNRRILNRHIISGRESRRDSKTNCATKDLKKSNYCSIGESVVRNRFTLAPRHHQRESRPTHQILKHRFRFALEIDTTSGGRAWVQTPSVLIELMGALARGGTPGDRRATRGVPGFSQKKGSGNLTSLSLPLKGAAFCQQFHGDPSTACFTPFATHLSN